MYTDNHNKKRGFKQERRHIYTEESPGPYRETQKFHEPTLCTECGALFVNGRWSWDDIPEEASGTVCPACRRIADKYPAGRIELSGDFFNSHREELMNRVQNVKNQEIAAHPLERIMEIYEEEGKTIILTTGIHLARRIGGALFNAYEGDLNYSYEEDAFVRVFWKR